MFPRGPHCSGSSQALPLSSPRRAVSGPPTRSCKHSTRAQVCVARIGVRQQSRTSTTHIQPYPGVHIRTHAFHYNTLIKKEIIRINRVRDIQLGFFVFVANLFLASMIAILNVVAEGWIGRTFTG